MMSYNRIKIEKELRKFLEEDCRFSDVSAISIPEDAIVGTVTPKPTRIASNHIKWHLDSIHPTGKIDVHFELAGLGKGDFDENDMYIENINPSYVIGADKWEGE